MAKRAAQRRAARDRARGRRSGRWSLWIALGALGLLVVAAIGLALRGTSGGGDDVDPELVAELTSGSCEFDTRADAGRDHVSNPSYTVDPPAGGAHLSTPAQPGIYAENEVPPPGAVVHALEHGFIALWFQPDLPGAADRQIAEVVGRFRRELLVIPKDDLEVPVALTAWNRRLLCSEVEPDTMSTFIREFRDEAPETGFL